MALSRQRVSNDPSTRACYADAVAAVKAGVADGIGYMLKDSNIGAIDLDHCADRETAKLVVDRHRLGHRQARRQQANTPCLLLLAPRILRLLKLGLRNCFWGNALRCHPQHSHELSNTTCFHVLPFHQSYQLSGILNPLRPDLFDAVIYEVCHANVPTILD
jgi:hypothetical protein